MIRSALFAAATALLALACSAAAQDVAIINANVAIGDGGDPIEGATVLVQRGKVVAAGRNISIPADTPTLDGSGTWVTPGLVLAVTDLGLADVGAVSQSNDKAAAKSRFNAALDIAPAINPESLHIKVSRAAGLTRAVVVPSHGGSLFAGQGAIIALGSDGKAVRHPRALQLVALDEGGAQISGGGRAASFAELRNALREARDYAAGRWSGEDNLLTRADAEALSPVASGKQKLFVEVERASDIRAVLALKAEFAQIDMVLVGVSEGWLVADEIAAAGVPVVADALDDLPSSFEQLGATQSNVGRMAKVGVKVAIGRFAGSTDGHPRSLAQFAGNLVALTRVPGATGLSWGQALAAITSVPADIAGHGGHFGVLSPGAHGDLVIWDGDPLEVSSAPMKVFIDGVEQSLENHQTRLRDRYRDLDESDLPKAYDH